jgi:hypothetical protein
LRRFGAAIASGGAMGEAVSKKEHHATFISTIDCHKTVKLYPFGMLGK